MRLILSRSFLVVLAFLALFEVSPLMAQPLPEHPAATENATEAAPHESGVNGNEERIFLQGIDAFYAGHFDQAVQAFATLTRQGIHNGHLFYNLGNAYLKDGHIGPAIYWYERAVPFLPTEADLAFNLDYARSLCVDNQPDTDAGLHRIFFFWEHLLPTRTIQYLCLIFNAIVWLGLGTLLVRSSPVIKLVTLGSVLVLLTLAPSALKQNLGPRLNPQAIVLSPTAIVRSGKSQTTTPLFKLHAGTRVQVDKQTREHVKIHCNATMFGWMDNNDLGIL